MTGRPIKKGAKDGVEMGVDGGRKRDGGRPRHPNGRNDLGAPASGLWGKLSPLPLPTRAPLINTPPPPPSKWAKSPLSEMDWRGSGAPQMDLAR